MTVAGGLVLLMSYFLLLQKALAGVPLDQQPNYIKNNKSSIYSDDRKHRALIVFAPKSVVVAIESNLGEDNDPKPYRVVDSYVRTISPEKYGIFISVLSQKLNVLGKPSMQDVFEYEGRRFYKSQDIPTIVSTDQAEVILMREGEKETYMALYASGGNEFIADIVIKTMDQSKMVSLARRELSKRETRRNEGFHSSDMPLSL